jgi:hypothetical protein
VREALADAKQAEDVKRIGELGQGLREREHRLLKAVGHGFDSAANDTDQLEAILPKLGELRYLRRVFEEIAAIEDHLLG